MLIFIGFFAYRNCTSTLVSLSQMGLKSEPVAAIAKVSLTHQDGMGATRISMVRPAQPERLKSLAHRTVWMGGLRFDPGADDIADQAVHRRRNPRVVARIPPGPPRRRRRASQDRRVQPIDRPRPLPTPPATRSIEAASARQAAKAMEEGPHGRENRTKRALKLLGMFGKSCALRIGTSA